MYGQPLSQYIVIYTRNGTRYPSSFANVCISLSVAVVPGTGTGGVDTYGTYTDKTCILLLSFAQQGAVTSKLRSFCFN